jgi:anti-anti-sigma regulatory factor
LPIERGALVDAISAWRAEGVGHLLINVGPSTRETFQTVLEAMAAAR